MKSLVFDVNVLLDLWLTRVEPDRQLLIAELIANGQQGIYTGWVCSTSLPILEYITRRELKKSGQSPEQAIKKTHALLEELLIQVNLLSNFGFQQGDALQLGSDLEDAQIVLAASLLQTETAIVTNDKRFQTSESLIQLTPEEAKTWLVASDNGKSLSFIDLKTQQDAIRPALERNIHRVLHHGQYILGPEVKALEDTLQDYTGAKHCITVASGTEALLISLMALGIGPGDEVITTPFTFVATAEVIVLLGARPVFVDIEPDTGNIDASKIEEKITAQTKAIMPVSLYGQPADMDEINAIAARHGNIPVIEDAAQSFGATYKGRKSCNLSTLGCTSFFPSKPLGGYGDGGAIFTNDDRIAKACKEIRVHGQSQRYVHTRIGVGGRMDTLQCAIVLAKLERFDWEVEQRQRVAERYHQSLAAGNIGLLSLRPDRTCVYAQYTVLTHDRAALQQRLNEAGIPTAVHYPMPLSEQPAYKHLCCPNCTPIAQQIAKQVISLPMSPDLSEAHQQHIVKHLL